MSLPIRPSDKQYRVRIDGQVFECPSYQKALNVLEQAQTLAQTLIESQLPKTPDEPLPRPTLPQITVSSRELRKAAGEARRAIRQVYDTALMHAELTMLLERSRRREEDESVLLLM